MLELLEWLTAYSIRASLLCIAALLILASLKRASASLRSGVVFAGTLGAILLPISVGVLPPISLSIFYPAPEEERVSLENVTVTDEGRVELVGHQVAPQILSDASVPQPHETVGTGSGGWVRALGWIWIGGVGISLFILGVRLRSVLTLRSSASRLPLNHHLMIEANRVSVGIGYGRVLDVRVSEKVQVPSAIGLGLKTIIVPAGFEQLEPASRQAVLIHECAHLRRRDSLVQVLISLCRCFHWFNPLFLALDRAFNAEAEKACDDQVIGHGIPPASYSETILGYYQAAITAPNGAVWNRAASGFYPFPQLDRELKGRKKMILGRIRRMVDPAAKRSRIGGLAGWALVGISSASASVLGALVFVPDYEWRYQLAERTLPCSDQLVACWRMDDIRSEVTVESGPRGLHGMVKGGSLDQQGRLDNAIYLDGDDFVDMGDRFGGLEFPITLSAWVRADPNPQSASQNIVWMGGGGPDRYIYIGLNHGRPAIKSRYGEVAVALAKPRITDGAWHHLAGVFVSENHRLLYLDGELAAEDRRMAVKPPTFHVQVGRNGRVGNQARETSYIQGSIDDVRVYRKALDQESVKEIMKGDFALVAARRVVSRR